MSGLDRFIGLIRNNQISGELWIDGSFMSQKIEPNDVDFVLWVSANLYDGDMKAREFLDWVESDGNRIKNDYSCHVFRELLYPDGHRLHYLNSTMRDSWQSFFGQDEEGSQRGLAGVLI